MSRDLSDVITRLSASIAAGDKNPHYRRAAAITGGLPVYADIGGILVIARDGEVVCLDLEKDVTNRETDPKWRLFALAIAARSHSDLADLVPPRPPAARTCEQCGGTGMFLGILCGDCNSLGWVARSSAPDMDARLDDLIALNPGVDGLRREALARARELSTPELLLLGVQIIDERSGDVCALYCEVRPTKSTYVRSIVGNGLFIAVALWLQILGPYFRATRAHADLEAARLLLTDIWTTIGGKVEQTVEHVVPLLLAGYIVGAGLRDAYEGLPVRESFHSDFIAQSDVFASLRRCRSLGDLVREARSQLGFAEGATR